MARWRNSDKAYGIIAQLLHWCVAALVFVQLPLGLYAANLPVSMARLQWLSYHKSLGITILTLMLVRLIWRFIDAPPLLPTAMPAWERRAAHIMHWTIYVVLLPAMLAGWLYASALGLSINWFGLVVVPDLIAKNTDLAPLFKSLHHILIALFTLLLVGHIGAAIRHAFVLRDRVVRRMLPGGLQEKE